MTADFAEWVLRTCVEDQSGEVFGIARMGFGQDRIGKVISSIGKKAKVVVNKEQDKYASAHDLRRAFGTRWACRVTPAVLQQLMRHASIETTLKYYVEQNAEVLGAEWWNICESHHGVSEFEHTNGANKG